MRIVFMGTPAFSAAILEELAGQHEVVGAFTRPDAVRGRGKALMPSPVKECAERLGIPTFTPKNLREDGLPELMAELDPDVICVAAYGAILPRWTLDAPRLGCINVHASLLPRWRGAAPVERAILAGDEETGVCIMRMEEGLDTGDWCVCRSVEIGDMDQEELTGELSTLGARALLTALAQIEAGEAVWTAQDDAEATYADKIAKSEVLPDPALSAVDNLRRIRASAKTHPARARIAGREVRITRARLATAAARDEFPHDPDAGAAQREGGSDVAPGKVAVRDGRLLLGCADGALEVLALQPAGKAAMEASAFACGLGKAADLTWEAIGA